MIYFLKYSWFAMLCYFQVTQIAKWFHFIYMYVCLYIWMNIYMDIYFFRFFSFVDYYEVLSIVSCAIQCTLLLLLLSRFSRVWLCATPEMAAPQDLLSLGFSRQERWSGLPFPSPVHKSEKWKWSRSVVSDFLATPWTAAYQAPLSMGFARQEYSVH